MHEDITGLGLQIPNGLDQAESKPREIHREVSLQASVPKARGSPQAARERLRPWSSPPRSSGSTRGSTTGSGKGRSCRLRGMGLDLAKTTTCFRCPICTIIHNYAELKRLKWWRDAPNTCFAPLYSTWSEEAPAKLLPSGLKGVVEIHHMKLGFREDGPHQACAFFQVTCPSSCVPCAGDQAKPRGPRASEQTKRHCHRCCACPSPGSKR